jgi:YD repeat-containing protein
MICSKRLLSRCGYSMMIGIAGLFMLGHAEAANGSVVYGYDALGRLISARYDTGVCIAYTYDANGNRTSEKILVVSSSSIGIWGCFNWDAATWGP